MSRLSQLNPRDRNWTLSIISVTLSPKLSISFPFIWSRGMHKRGHIGALNALEPTIHTMIGTHTIMQFIESNHFNVSFASTLQLMSIRWQSMQWFIPRVNWAMTDATWNWICMRLCKNIPKGILMMPGMIAISALRLSCLKFLFVNIFVGSMEQVLTAVNALKDLTHYCREVIMKGNASLEQCCWYLRLPCLS